MDYTPKQIVQELDRYIIGQNEAKKAVAIALRNRYRRNQLPAEMKEDITPKNIIMQGPTGVGKTEIARRLAKIVKAPFVKVEATKFTEVGYVGRDVESMVRDLAEMSVRLVREEHYARVEAKAKDNVERILVKELLKEKKANYPDLSDIDFKEKIVSDYRDGKLNDEVLEIELPEIMKPMELSPGSGMELNIGNIFDGIIPKKTKKREVTVAMAQKVLMDAESGKLIDEESVNQEAIRRAENEGIIFVDEIDKVASKGNSGGHDVSREGVQRDILPIVEGCTVNTKYGALKTDYVLFIAAGAFHISSVDDLIPELQGRFPISVKLNSLTEKDFVEILKNTDNAVIKQYCALLRVDHVILNFTDEAIEEIAKLAFLENETNQNIGARRLHTIMEMLLDDISFNAGGLSDDIDLKIDRQYVKDHLAKSIKILNVHKFIL